MRGSVRSALAFALLLAAGLWAAGLGCKQNIPPATAFIVTPCPTPILFNDCESLTSNGSWNAISGITYTSILSVSNLYFTQGAHSLDVDITTPVAYNQNMMILSGFTPNVWANYTQLTMDVTVDPTVVAGASYGQFDLIGNANVAGKYFSTFTSNAPNLLAGSQSVTWNIDFSVAGGTLQPTDSLYSIYFIYNRSTPSTGQGIGNIYVDNIRLIQNCP
jgi:hypothetical protein